jgi:hypothetical protein
MRSDAGPTSIELRTYQVGFGDCFLLSFVYGPEDRRHVLIDFGTAQLPPRGRAQRPARPADHMPKIAGLIREACGGAKGRLTALVATHRHTDHISGFGTDAATGESGRIIQSLRPRLVIQPWTEDPLAAEDATHATTDAPGQVRAFTAGLAAMHSVAEAVVALTDRPPAWMAPALARELRFLGLDNIANRSAVESLIAMGRARGAKAIWARHGTQTGIERLLPGVRLHVLGPPSLAQRAALQGQHAIDGQDYWRLVSGTPAQRAALPLARGLPGAAAERSVPVPPQARWFRDRLERLRGQQVLEIVRSLDEQMNNTSLILLFEAGQRKLLFPGDAQLEDWSYALQDAPDAAATRALLAGTDLYKVGHHGSLNATPRQLLWANFDKRGHRAGQRLTSVLSTLSGKHGHATSHTEVPRLPLLRALQDETDLINTDNRRAWPASTLFQCLEMPV